MKLESLSFDLRNYGLLLGNWHASQGDPVYVVGSWCRAYGTPHPQRETVEGCLHALENLVGGKHLEPVDNDELLDLVSWTEELLTLDQYRRWEWGEELYPTQAEAEEAIAGYCRDKCDDACGTVTFGDQEYVIEITAKLVPR